MASSRHKKNKYRRDEETLRAALRQKLAPQQKDSIFKSSFAAFGSMDSANKGSGDAKSSSVADPLKSDTWYYLFQDMIEMFSYRLRFSPQSPKDEIKIFYIGSQGLIAARFIRGNETFNVFANIDEEGEIEEECDYLAFGCSCRASQGKYECEHSCRLINGVIGLLSKADSDLSARINQGRFSAEPLDMSMFRFDRSKETLAMLSSFAVEGNSSDDFAELTPSAEREVCRVAWNVRTLNQEYGIELMVQPTLKRGGFGKGKKAKLSSLFQENLVLTEADKRVRQKLSIHADRYSETYKLRLEDALEQLIGESNVLLDGVPATVGLADAILTLQLQRGVYEFVAKDSKNTSFKLLLNEDALIQIDAVAKNIGVRKSNRSESLMMRQLLNAEPVDKVHEKQLAENVKKMQFNISLRLPESMGGPCVMETVRPVLILRSKKDGALDYGIRIRDSRNKLFKPGQGLLIHAGKLDGRDVQFQRDVVAEDRLLRDVQERLDLDFGSTDGTLQGFERGMNLIDRLQSSCTDLEVSWDKASEQPLKFIGTVSSSNVRVGIAQKRDWFSLTGECTLGEQTIDIASLIQGLRESSASEVRGEFVRIGDSGWAKISDQLRSSLRKLDDSINQERGALRFDRTSAHALRDLQQHIQVDSGKAWNECLLRLDRAEKLEPTLPKGLKATMRDYQIEGFKWLRRLAEWGVGGVLADDMGLGKTVQTLAAVLDRASEGPTLVIAPTSVCFNWMREIEKFAPELTGTLYRETDRAEFLDSVGPYQVVVCSYGLALRDFDRLAKVDWATMVLDEAQAIKNSRSKTSMAIAKIPSKWTVALTGTPVENHLGELWSLFHVVSPGVLGGWDQFRNRFAAPIEKDNDDDRRTALRNRLTPFILRRTKGEVLKDLPPRTEMNLYVELSAAERAIYDSVRISALGEVDAIAKLPEIQDQRFRILALLTRLRQIACHPGMVHETWTEGSAKLTQLHETLLQLREEGHRVLIFSQFVKHLTLIREMMDKEKITYQYLDGSTPPEERQKQVDVFQNGDATAFLISLKAGGTGLNLTAADYVIHMDPWWNPAVEDQATDRAHRIGQEKPVMVYRIVAQNTIEEEILRLHDTKRDLVAGVLDGTHSAAKLSTEDLIAMLRT
jgi:SNF2 family DNA or RNA helicase